MSRKSLAITVVAVLVATAAIVAALDRAGVVHIFSKSTPTSQETQLNQQKKAQTIDSGGSTNVSTDGKTGTATDNTYTPPAGSNNLTVSASKANATTVAVSTELKNYSDGTCQLVVQNGASNVTQNAQVIFAPDFSTCAGFSVPISSLGTGTWSITLNVTSGGTTETKSITYEVN